MQDKCAAIIVAGGSGKRFGSKTPKQFLDLFGSPVFMWSVRAFQKTKLFSQIILVAPDSKLGKLARFARSSGFEITRGGKERPDSVKAGLKVLNKDINIVAVHDAARPLITPQAIKRAVDCAKKYGAAVSSVPARDTIKLTKGESIIETIPRGAVWLAQTPQVFKRSVLEKAYSRLGRAKVTDDAQAVERLGIKVRVAMGDYKNIKVTDKEDFKAVRALLNKI